MLYRQPSPGVVIVDIGSTMSTTTPEGIVLMENSTDAALHECDIGGRSGSPAWLNWLLALLTVPVAMAVTLFAFGAVMGLARCTEGTCPHMGPGEFWFGVLAYGPPFVALTTIAMSLFTASRRHAIWVPIIGLALLVVDMAVLAVTFRS